MKIQGLMTTAALAALLAACSQPAGETDSAGADDAANDSAETASVEDMAETVASTEATLGEWGVETDLISDTVDPGDDFYRYVNEGWLDAAEMPAGFSSFGGFTELFLEAEERIETIIQEAMTSDAEIGTPEQQIGDLYASYMNRDLVEELGIQPIEEELNAVLNVSDHEEVARWFGRQGHGSIFGSGVGLDSGDPTRYIMSVSQGGLSMPTRDYYLDETERFANYRTAFVDYVEEIFTLAEVDNPRERAEAVMAIETALAEVHWTRAEQRDRVRNYNLMTMDGLNEYAPDFNWTAFFEEQGVADQTEVVVNTDSAVQASAEVFAGFPAEDWGSYLAFQFIDNYTSMLPAAFDDANFDFYARTLNGTEEQRPLDRRAIQFVNGRFGENLGKVYVERHFPPDYKEQMDELVEYLRRAFDVRLDDLEWMDDETRAEAKRKLEAFIPKIGYPDVWRDYSSIEIDEEDLIGNARRISEWGWEDSRSRLGGPRRDWEWFMNPQTVNAYYSSQRNEIVFPAAILQAPFFDPAADPAVNFGAIGGVIGHEMGHGFDDQGSRSDADGVLRNWWTDFSREQFEARTNALVAQYDGFSPIEGINVNGRLSLGENIGDLGGLSIAHQAYQMYLEDNHGGEAPVLDGYTGDQRFFLAWGQVWRGIMTEDNLVSRLQRGPHSPWPYRTNGVVRNIDAWYAAFDVTEDDELYLPPEERVSIW